MGKPLSHQPPAPITAGVLTVLLILGLAGGYWWLNVIGITGTDLLWFLIPLAFFLLFALAFRMRQYADLVEDCGENLHVVHGSRDFVLPLKEIRTVRLPSTMQKACLVKLKLAPGSSHGSSVRFYSALPLERPTIHADLEDLRSRVEGQWRP